jgi:hypothetical protein
MFIPLKMVLIGIDPYQYEKYHLLLPTHGLEIVIQPVELETWLFRRMMIMEG